MSALLIMHMQNDFIEGGTINTPYSLKIIPIINRVKEKFKLVIFIKDLHPSDHVSFIKNGGTLPPHCVANTDGAELHQCIKVSTNDHIISKGMLTLYDSSSAFYNAKDINKETNLDSTLRKNNIKNVYICGLVVENEIFSTVIDAMRFRYNVFVITDASSGIDDKKIKKCLDFCKTMDVTLTTSSTLLVA